MMDLTRKSLPNVVMINGREYSIYTDFRLWMRFEIEVSKMKTTDNIDVSYLFKNEKPRYCNLEELFVFAKPANELPRNFKHSNVRVLDYEVDAELIFSAFLEQYGIDLFEIEELHWHKFLALLKGLNDSTRLREVMGYRSYEKSNEKNRDIYAELRAAWALEEPISEEEQAELEEFNKKFGG